MLVGDLIYNDDFDVNCNVAVYRGTWNDGGIRIWNSNTKYKPPYALLDKKIGYITLNIERKEIIVEIEED